MTVNTVRELLENAATAVPEKTAFVMGTERLTFGELDYGLNQIFCALFNRATLAIHRFVLPQDFFAHLIDDGVTVLPLMPIHVTQMFDTDIHRIPKPEHFAKLRAVTSSGGNLTPLMIKNLTIHFPDT